LYNIHHSSQSVILEKAQLLPDTKKEKRKKRMNFSWIGLFLDFSIPTQGFREIVLRFAII
jgi:hypothetical protein